MIHHQTIPVLETDRLILSGHQCNDFSALADLWAKESVVQYIGGTISTERESWMRMLSYAGLWRILGFGYWAIREKESGKYIGDLGFADFHRTIDIPIKGVPEAGWVIAPEYQGKGYVTEAMQSALTWLTLQNRFEKSICFIDSDNIASLRVADKLGYLFEQKVLLNGEENLLYCKKLIPND
ncbi:GNAT family N-acetyltransferase [Ignatzschineria rhizosphaerae]|uniref:GNAT family N-acetyltransferase n=1 Tax=Ignatzschineria rhizosphaerae TaxID=2923279 RepID=A0ABY3X254_9GAMM|nr:GNAT family N-acetyltransferase [Ignatzschineria rhizosphaerae]UNM96957.1 GNAT family N-acetyltransferase [Ignatzschineria rhizosphaerae]